MNLPDEGELEPARESDVDRDTLRRALRDLEAAEARVARNAERVYDETRDELLGELFPLLDDLDRVVRAADESNRDPALVEALHLLRGRFDRVLARYGAARIDATDQRFDPALHDAIAAVPVSDPRLERMVIEQLEPGYRVGDRVLRHARVAVGVRHGHRQH